MGQRGGLTNLCIVGRCLACAEMGSCVQLNMSIQCFGVCLSHTHISSCSAYHPHVGEKPLQLLQISPFRLLQKRDPRLSQASKSIICSGHLKRAPGGHIPNPRNYQRFLPIFSSAETCSASLWIQMWPWMFHCVSAPQQAAARCLDIQLTNM